MKKLLLTMMLAIAVACTAQAAETTKSLYDRLGGYNALSAVANDLLPRLQADKQLGRFWANRGIDGVQREKQLLIDFLSAKSGGPMYYTGRNMVQTHVGMKISESDWNIFIGHLKATLTKFKVPKKETSDVLGFIGSLKTTMVEK